MTRTALRSALLATALLAASGSASFTSPVRADDWTTDDKKDDKKDKQKEAERRQRENNLKDIGGDFGAKHIDALLKRVPKDQKISLALGKDNTGEYSIDQARGVLTKYFDAMRSLSVDFEKADEKVGCFKLTIRRMGEDKDQVGKLYVTLGVLGAGNVYTLAKLEVQM